MGTRGFATQQEPALYASPVQKTWLKDKKVSFMSTLTQDVRGAAGGLEENKPDQNYTFIHKQAQGAMAVTLLMNKIVQNLAKHSSWGHSYTLQLFQRQGCCIQTAHGKRPWKTDSLALFSQYRSNPSGQAFAMS